MSNENWGYNTSCMAIVIENLPVPLLLGMEFLKSNHAKIDLDKFEVSFSRNDQSIAIRLPKPHQPSHTLFFNSTQTNLPVETQPKKPLEKTNTSRKSEKEAQEQNYAPNRNVAEVDFTTFINSNQNFEEEIAQVKIEEKNIDIFNIGNQFALAHGISADGKLGAGIAKSFDNIFSLGEEIKESRPITGSVITTKRNGRIIYNLVTKTKYWEKPTLETMWSCLVEMKKKIVENKVTKLAIPKIGCGLDKMNWNTIKNMITYILKDVEIDIIICVVQKPPVETPSEVAIIHEEERMVKRLKNTSKSEDCRVKNQNSNENNRFKVILIEDYCLRPNEKSKMEVEIVGLPKRI
ncbi:hypothetical protein JTB14_009754 [Gonioctena quinquepunctata]|nr:hypothetical protein JTB14_009754 [Gonioctena quinquepunctata]